MHYESVFVFVIFAKLTHPQKFLFSNSALGEEFSIKPSSKVFLLNQEKQGAGSFLHSQFVFSIASSFLFYHIANPCILSLISSRHSPSSKWLHKMTVSLSRCFLPLHDLHSTDSFASLLIVCLLWESREKDAVKKSKVAICVLPFASQPCTLTPFCRLWYHIWSSPLCYFWWNWQV